MELKVPSEVEQIKAAAGEYRKWALEARKKYIELRLLQDPEIRKLYEQAADKVARELRDLAGPSGQLRRRQLETLEKILRAEADSFTNKFSSALGQYIYQASDAGVGYSRAVLLNVFGRAGVNITGLKTFYSMVNPRRRSGAGRRGPFSKIVSQQGIASGASCGRIRLRRAGWI